MSVWRGTLWGADFERRIKTETFIVHSVFHRVANLQSDLKKPLLSLVTCLEAMGPNALWVIGGGLDEFKVGSSVRFGSGQLITGSISLDCSAATRYGTKFKRYYRRDFVGVGAVTVRAPVAGDVDGVGDGSGARNEDGNGVRVGARDGDANVVTPKSGALQRVQAWLETMSPGLTTVRSPLTDQLTQGLLTQDEGLVRLALRGFIGQGEGLTPSGDDFVAGVLLSYIKGFQLTDQMTHQTSAFLARIRCLVEEVWWRTTTISQTMLWYAARGDGAGYVAETAEALYEESDQALELAARLWAVGASSGRFLLAGVLVGNELFKTREHDELGRNNGNSSKYLRGFCDTDGLIPKGTTA